MLQQEISLFNKNNIKTILKETWRGIQDDHLGVIASGVAFYCFLGVFPFITVCVTIYQGFLSFVPVEAGLFLDFLPPSVNHVIETQLGHIGEKPAYLSLSTLFSIGVSIWTASLAMRNLIEGLDIAYRVKKSSGAKRATILSIITTIVVASFLFGFFLIASVLPLITRILFLDQLGKGVLFIIDASFLIFCLYFVMNLVYYKLPNHGRDLSFRDNSLGSLLVAIFIGFSSYAFTAYIKYLTDFSAVYGALSGVIIFLIWLRLIVLMVLVGAKLNYSVITNRIRLDEES